MLGMTYRGAKAQATTKIQKATITAILMSNVFSKLRFLYHRIFFAVVSGKREFPSILTWLT